MTQIDVVRVVEMLRRLHEELQIQVNKEISQLIVTCERNSERSVMIISALGGKLAESMASLIATIATITAMITDTYPPEIEAELPPLDNLPSRQA